MRAVKAFGAFCYDFVIGDDWKIAVAVVVAVTLTALLMLGHVFGDHVLAVVGALLVAVLFSLSVVVDTRGDR
jgi:hypothetical protein